MIVAVQRGRARRQSLANDRGLLAELLSPPWAPSPSFRYKSNFGWRLSENTHRFSSGLQISIESIAGQRLSVLPPTVEVVSVDVGLQTAGICGIGCNKSPASECGPYGVLLCQTRNSFPHFEHRWSLPRLAGKRGLPRPPRAVCSMLYGGWITERSAKEIQSTF